MANPRRLALLSQVVFHKTSYKLRDDFNDTLAAGSVNGTPATPGPGTRVVVDTENKVTVADGLLKFASGKAAPAYGDPCIWGSGVAVVPGLCLLVDINAVVASGIMRVGTDDAQSGSSFVRYFSLNGTTIRDSSNNVMFTINAGEALSAIMIVCNPEYYVLIRGATPTGNLWKLAIVRTIDSVVTAYPFITDYGQTALNIRRMGVPKATFIMPLEAYDSFTRAALGSTETAAPGGQIVTARAWTNQVGTVTISGNAAIASALGGDRAICTFTPGTANLWLAAKLTKGTTGAGVLLRYQDADNYVYCWHNGTNLQLVRRAAGVETALINAAATYAAAAPILAVLDGTLGDTWYNGAKIGTQQTVPASTYTPCGLIFFDTDSTMDTLSAFARGNEGQYSVLNRYSPL